MQTKYFILQELVPQAVYLTWGNRAWQFLDPRMLEMLDKFRSVFGKTVVNNWHLGGSFQESGLREWGTRTGAVMSQHKFGGAIDAKVAGKSPIEITDYILLHRDDFPWITTIEDPMKTKTWLHWDVRNLAVSLPGIQIIQP